MAELDRLVPEPADFTVRDVILFKSDLKPTGAVYTVLERFP
jgi:2'-5' RNA ligase